MTLLDSSSVNVALPGIIGDFHSTVSRGQLVVTIYLVALAVVIPVSGFLGERVGMKRLYMGLLLAFAATSALCAVAASMPQLIGFRALQGLGGGMLQPVGMAIIFTMITPLERGRFMILLGLPILLAPIVGPTVGGYLTQYVSWRAIFLINIPIGLINIVLALFLLKETEIKAESRLDSKGLALSALSFPTILFALSEASDVGWGSPLVVALLVLGFVALGGFIAVELRQKQPMLDLRLFNNAMFAMAIAITFVVQFSFFGTSYLLPLFLQGVRGLGPADTGLVMFPSGILDFAGIFFSGRLYNRFGPRPFAIAGMAVLTLSSFGLSRMTATTSILTITAIASLRGLGIGLAMMPVITMAFNTVPKALIGRATALQNVLQRVFGSASAAVLTAIAIAALTVMGASAGSSLEGSSASTDQLVTAFGVAFTVMAVIAALGTLLSLRLRDAVLEQHLEERRAAEAVPAEVDS
jgi:EmrB/QacA subfamily drug resistance transporter